MKEERHHTTQLQVQGFHGSKVFFERALQTEMPRDHQNGSA
jgi:hypothetical protein